MEEEEGEENDKEGVAQKDQRIKRTRRREIRRSRMGKKMDIMVLVKNSDLLKPPFLSDSQRASPILIR